MSAMGGYERDEYEDLDEYEDDCGEQEYEDGDEFEYEEEQVHQPTQEELDYLEMRQKLKENIRKKMNKELGTANGGSCGQMNASRKDNYGSFFGPSQPVIAQRVIQESKSLLENPNLAARISKLNLSMNTKNRVSSNSAGSKPRANPPKAINGLKKKVELIKDTRDYSFLLSEDAEIPAPTKTSQPNLSASKSDARSAQLHPKINQVANDRGKDSSNICDVRKPIIANSQTRPKVGSSASSKSPMEYRKQLGSNKASGPGRPVGSQGGHFRSSAMGKKIVNSGGKTNPAGGVRKPMPSGQPQMSKRVPTHLQNKPVQSSVSRNTSVQKSFVPKGVPRSSYPSSIDGVRRAPAKITSRVAVSDQRPKPKPVKRPCESDDEGDRALSLIRNMFRYNPSRYHDDEDDRDMVAGFDDIRREEDRSARIARKEDEEQARLLEEEEKRRRMAKKRKMGH